MNSFDEKEEKLNMKNNEPQNKKSRWSAIILAAGKGTRMKTPLPKVLHPVAGRPMIVRVIEACKAAGIEEIRVVTGFGGQLVQSVVEPLGVRCYPQAQQLGTADAVRAAQPENIKGNIVILNGDHPLIEASDLKDFFTQFIDQEADLAVVSAELKKPGEFGRIIRHMGELKAIVEARDASAETLKIREVNTGIYCATADYLADYLPRVKNQNLKHEFYLTDIVSLGVEDRCRVQTLKGHPRVSFGVNSQAELTRATKIVFARKVKQMLENGVMILDPRTAYVEEPVEVGAGTVLYPNVYLRGSTKIGQFVAIEPNCYLMDTLVEESVLIRANSYFESCTLKARCSVGPFARIRPETEIGEEAHVGNFVEMKKVKFGAKAKAGHLTYLGDAEVGKETNIGCGTITCNYAVDHRKYKTVIGERVFVGSDSQFVAPVTIGDDAVIASGSTITESVPARSMAIARSRQVIKADYVQESSEKESGKSEIDVKRKN